MAQFPLQIPAQLSVQINTTMNRFRFIRSQMALLLSIAACSSIAGQVITLQVNNDPPLCRQLRKLIVESRLAQASNSQLCDFKFSKYPPIITNQFTFPEWREMRVTDPVKMYLRMQEADRSPDSVANLSDNSATVPALRKLVKRHNISFFKAMVPMITYDVGEGDTTVRSPVKSVAMLKMMLRRCSRYLSVNPAPYSVAYTSLSLAHPIPANSMMVGGEIVIWKGWIPLIVSVSPKWMRFGLEPYEISVTADNLWESTPRSLDGKIITGASLCVFNITKGLGSHGH